MTAFNAYTWPIRLSPSGPFLRDPDSSAPLLFGPGSTGIIIRAQGTSGSAQAISSTAATLIDGLDAIPVNMPKGYHYDVSARLVFSAPIGVDDPGVDAGAVVEYSTDGVTYNLFTTAGSPSGVPRMYALARVRGSNAIEYQEIDIDLTAAAADITHLRVSGVAPGVSTLELEPGLCTLRVEQYIPPQE